MTLFRTLALPASIAMLAMLGACEKAQPPAPEGTATEAVEEAAGPDAKPGIAASRGRLVLPVVAGNPAAVYFSVRNDGPAAATLAAIHVDGAGKAEMHKTEGGSMAPVHEVQIGPGASVEFAPGGYHVMAFDLDGKLAPGNTTEITLTFSDGDKLSMPVRIEKMGADMGGGHTMGDMHR